MVKNTEKQIDETAAEAQKTVVEGVETLTRGMEGAAQFGQENVEAVVQSSRIAAKAAETMSAEIAAYSKKSYEDSLAAAKDLTSAKSVSEFIEKQTNYTKSAFEGFVSEASRMNELYANAAREAFEPITQRFTAAFDAVRNTRA